MKTTRHLTAIIILCLTTALTARAEGGMFEFGIKGGVTTNNVNFSKPEKYDNGEYGISTNGRFGYHLGMMSRINLPLVHFQPEILFSNTGYRINTMPRLRPNEDGYASKSIVRLRTLDVPMLVGLKMLWLRVQAGPMFTVMSEAKLKDKQLVRDIQVTKPSVSYLLGIGLDLGHFNFDVRFNGNFKKSTQDLVFETTSGTSSYGYKTKNRYWMFSVGYMF